jgi:hypothetical protein
MHTEHFMAKAFSLSSKHIFPLLRIVGLLLLLKKMCSMELFVVEHHKTSRKLHICGLNNL